MKQLAGRIGVGFIFVNGGDASLTFTDTELATTRQNLMQGLDWLARQNRRVRLEWVVDEQVVDVAQTDRPGTTINSWTLPALGALGVGRDGANSPERYVDRLKARLEVDQAVVAYVGKYSGNSGAMLDGPATWLRQATSSIMTWVLPHELLHLFGAPDEYGNATCTPDGCDRRYGQYRQPNGNCKFCGPWDPAEADSAHLPCLMWSRGDELDLCRFTVSHVGWNNPDVSPDVPLAVRNGRFWYIQADSGQLHWYRHLGVDDGSDNWANGGRAISIGGYGWGDYQAIHAGDDGVLYAVDGPSGVLHWYRHLGIEDGIDRWSVEYARRVGGTGWHQIGAVGSDGIMYGVNPAEGLRWYKHLGHATGSDTWANDWAGTTVAGRGWSGLRWFDVDEHGAIYALDRSGRLQFYRHDGHQDGSDRFTSATAVFLNSQVDWSEYRRVHASGNGVLYGVHESGELHWFRHDGRTTGDDDWASGGEPRKIGGNQWR